MKKTSNYLFILLVSLFVFNTFIKNSAEADATQSYASYSNGKAIFIDVREEDEVNEGMVKGALWVPLSKISQNLKTEIAKIKAASKDKEIFLYCRSGNRSGKVKDLLLKAGIKSFNLGGFSSLIKERLPTQKGPN